MKTVDYQPKMGEVTYPDGFFEVIKNLPIEAQSNFFRTTQRSSYSKTNWFERTLESTLALEENSDVKALIIKNGYIVGAMIEEWFSKEEKPVLLDHCICTYYASDNNGAGYKERQDYTFFICVPKSAQ